MQKSVSEHRAHAQANKSRHEFVINAGIETGYEQNADEREDGDDQSGQKTKAVDLRQSQLLGLGLGRVGHAGRRQRLLQQRRPNSALNRVK